MKYADKKTKNLYRLFLSTLLVAVLCSIFYVTKKDENINISESYAEENIKTVDYVNYSVDTSEYADDASTDFVIPVGEPIGIYVKTDGVMVVDTGEVTGNDGKVYSPSEGKLIQGDYIKEINGIEITDKTKLIEVIDEYGENTLSVLVERDETEIMLQIDAVKGKNDRYMIGLWVKDDISGIGTLTYVTKDGFGALGHSINDNDTGTVFKVSDGAIYPARLINIDKPEDDNPGRLEGIINYSDEKIIGRVNVNCEYGISGTINSRMNQLTENREWVPVGDQSEVHKGKAYILSCISGEAVYYEINIKSVSYSENDAGKEIEIEVTDERLIALTGGIVQGMSGTPILQDGKLVGAVTHVFLKDSTKGYGTFVEEMINSSND